MENSGIQHVVIDNLQFLINQGMMADEKSSGLDRFHLQDRFVGYMRQLATQNQIHITMVVHPRKTDGDTEIDVQHFGGSARVTQEADNVMAIQRKRDDRDRSKFRKFLYVRKVPFSQKVKKEISDFEKPLLRSTSGEWPTGDGVQPVDLLPYYCRVPQMSQTIILLSFLYFWYSLILFPTILIM